MEKQVLSAQRSPDTSNSNEQQKRGSLIREGIVRFALNADKALDAKEQSIYFKMWLDGFADIPSDRLSAAFVACLRSHAFKSMPTIADIRKHIDKAEGNSAEEQAALKWDEVYKMIRLHYSPDIPWHGPKISERTQRAINAAGGMAYIAECIGDDLVFARKRFFESYLRWDELKQDEYLLPDGEVKKLLADAARTMSIPRRLGSGRSPDAKPPQLPWRKT